ncbi:MAG: hypothetical protein EOO01_23270 [Chitinophagaceae bacterium]|nr:MAG: hypothetical protein EOO01_23270 [Chitinophagaceae bacterium]
MNISLRLGFIISALFFLSSCENSIDPTDPFPQRKYVDSIFFREPTGEISKTIRAEYDSLKRVTSILELKIYESFKSEYYYLNSDTVPFMSRIYHSDFTTTRLLHTTYRRFDAQHRIVYDSTFSPSSDTVVTHYEYVGNFRFGVGISTAPGSYIVRDTAVLDGRGNIINHREYHEYPTRTDLISETTMTYDNNPDPFAYMTNFYWERIPRIYGLFSLTATSTNNILFYNFSMLSASDVRENNFEYNDLQMPVYNRQQKNGMVSTITYEYKSL